MYYFFNGSKEKLLKKVIIPECQEICNENFYKLRSTCEGGYMYMDLKKHRECLMWHHILLKLK